MPAPTQFLSEILSLFGQPVAENPTQYMHERAFAELGLNWRYITLEVPPERLADAVRGMRAMNFAGGNCTIPHKIAVMQHLDAVTPAAGRIGAVNTIIRRPDRTLLGENTDGKGFLWSVREAGFGLNGCRAVILGAGGAARAIAVELAGAGAAHLTLVNRTPARGEALAGHVASATGVPVSFVSWGGEFPVPGDTQLVVNATSIALAPDNEAVVPVDYATLGPGMLVCDVIPNPPDTPFLQRARAQGAATLDGLGMLVYQGAIGFKAWTGHEAPLRVMHAALAEVFSGGQGGR
jgi:shikimate dehydrogenase